VFPVLYKPYPIEKVVSCVIKMQGYLLLAPRRSSIVVQQMQGKHLQGP
jgi:hypothetical protein